MTGFQIFQRIPRRHAWRGLWLALLLLHSPATFKAFAAMWAGGNAAAAGSALLLTASNLFFLLEILFAPSLHLLRDWRCAVALLLVVILLHAGVIEQAFPQLVVAREGQFWLVLGLTGLALARRLAALGRQARASLAGCADLLVVLKRRRYHRAALSAMPIIRPQAAWRSAPLRAPPIPTL